jgi:hypothetical protein
MHIDVNLSVTCSVYGGQPRQLKGEVGEFEWSICGPVLSSLIHHSLLMGI